MFIQRHIDNKVNIDYFFVKGKIEIDDQYFIEKIKHSCKNKNNMNNRTHVKGLMTPFDFFVNDLNFVNTLKPLISYIDKNYDLDYYQLKDAWGIELRSGEKTTLHNHRGASWSGVIYLNSSDQKLNFPEINQFIKPEKGVFGLFSSFLKHECESNNDEFSKFGLSFNFFENRNWP